MNSTKDSFGAIILRMQIRLFILAIMVLPLGVKAGWVQLAADEVAHEYVNLETVKQEGNIVMMWNMSDFTAPQPVGNGSTYLSSRVLQAYDCLSKKKQIQTLIHYRNPMGKGQLVFYDKTPGGWRKVAPGSLGEVHLNAACLAAIHGKPEPESP